VTHTTIEPTLGSICDLSRRSVIDKPFPHVVNDHFVAAPHFAQLRDAFPACPASTGPTGFSLYWEDDVYQQLLAHVPAWRALSDTFQSQRFIDWAIDQFAGIWAAEGCAIDLARARYVPYHEDRTDKERATLRRVVHAPEELWVRMDIHQGRVGYKRAIHRDHARRLISMLVYICDQHAIQMVGGELVLHASPLARLFRPSTTVEPRENLMVAFPCMNRSYHSVSEITSMAQPRNYLQIQISSSVDIWPRTRF
jgi:hypothetical protein